MAVFALTGSNSLASTGNWEKSKVIECDLNLFNKLKPIKLYIFIINQVTAAKLSKRLKLVAVHIQKNMILKK